MAILEILTHPDPRLRLVSRPVEVVDDAIRQLVDDMLETMYAAPGVGLAAPQVGVDRRIVVMDVGQRSGETDAPDPLVLINPVIVEGTGVVSWNEACLSVPGVSGEVERKAAITVEALGRDGQPFRFEATGLKAVCVQHELDHLEGTLYIDRLPPLERKLALQSYVGGETQEAPSGTAA